MRYARLYLRQSRASLGGYYGGNPRTSPKSRQCFSKYFRLDPKLLVSLEKWARGVSSYGTGPAKLWGRLRLRDMAPPHHPTPTLLMNANLLADVRPSRIQEHRNKVKKYRLKHTRPRRATLWMATGTLPAGRGCSNPHPSGHSQTRTRTRDPPRVTNCARARDPRVPYTRGHARLLAKICWEQIRRGASRGGRPRIGGSSSSRCGAAAGPSGSRRGAAAGGRSVS